MEPVKHKVAKKKVIAKKAPPQFAADELVTFINMTNRNIFTTVGRVGSHETIKVPYAEGFKTKGLDRV